MGKKQTVEGREFMMESILSQWVNNYVHDAIRQCEGDLK